MESPTLDTCRDAARKSLADIVQLFARADTRARYHRLRAGIWLLKAEAALTIPNDGNRNPTGKNQHGKRSVPSVGSDLATWEDGAPCKNGYLGFLAVSGIKQSTAYNYKNAALNCGFTAESDPAEVDDLEGAGTLDTMPAAAWSKLYQSADTIPPPPPPPPLQPQFEFVASTLSGIRDHTTLLVETLDAEDQLSPRARDTATARLRWALESITHQKWEPTRDAPDGEPLRLECREVYKLGQ